MGFLGKLFAKEKVYSLEEAMEIIMERHASLEAELAAKRKTVAVQVAAELAALKAAVEEFRVKKLDERYKGSEQVKERFCAIAEDQLSRLSPADSAGFLDEVRLVLNNFGGLTTRQLIHLDFFFKEDIQPVARKIKQINALLSSQTPSEYAKAVHLYDRIRGLESEKKSIETELVAAKIDMAALEAVRPPAAATYPSPAALHNAEKILSMAAQEVDSFLSVQKALKKYMHDGSIKDGLLQAYIESPSSAIMIDEHLQIIDYASAAAKILGANEKIAAILSSRERVREMKAALAEAHALVRAEREKFLAAKLEAEAANAEIARTAEDVASRIRELKKTIEEKSARNRAHASEMSRTRAELCMAASKVLKATVA